MADFISREEALEAHCMNCQYIDQEDDKSTCWCMGKDRINRIPTADVVARDCYDRILAENDMMREQLAQIGKKPGDTMDDVRPVVRARWEGETGYIFAVLAQRVYCPACKSYAYFYPKKTKNFCPNCGADMREEG